MKYTVIKAFRDKVTGTIHQAGEELELTKKRFEEINSTAFGLFVEKVITTKEEGG